MGLSLNEIKHSTLSNLSLYDMAFEIKKKQIDEQMYIMGAYNFRALTASLHNALMGFDSKHTHKPINYLEKPFTQADKEIEDMTDEEYDREVRKAIEIEQQYMNSSKLPVTVIARKGGKK